MFFVTTKLTHVISFTYSCNKAVPNYEFKKAFAITVGRTVKGYIVLIDANNTKYALAFDASGGFVKVKTIY